MLTLIPNLTSNVKVCHHYVKSLNSSNSDILVTNLYKYSRENLALVNVYIKQPVVTKILKDQRIPIIWFVANCGGILGLCMGFSIVTVFEVLHCITKSSCSSIASWYKMVRKINVLIVVTFNHL